MNDRELMQQALNALKFGLHVGFDESSESQIKKGSKAFDQHSKAITALRSRLAQPEQEPVAWEDVLGAIARGWAHDDNKHKTMDVQLAVAIAKEIQDMVIAPPHRKPLTDEEIFEISNGFVLCMFPVETRTTDRELAFARAIEKAVTRQPQIRPLTDDVMWKLWNAEGNDEMNQQEAIAFARAIEAAHGIKGEA